MLEVVSQVESSMNRPREEILSGALRPGDRLVEGQLIRRSGISRTPLREALNEALRLLDEQGLGEHPPRRGGGGRDRRRRPPASEPLRGGSRRRPWGRPPGPRTGPAPTSAEPIAAGSLTGRRPGRSGPSQGIA
ncbi:hypothetical protein Pmi06nite_22960 [Planotetraspora mira]|uniref:HTH gntR-type domain-containing protein n=1 Tax=Planotetraspora mira TaxID=58121 RepID=A0A8J3TMK4_9ACTN|nr:hypothetical protein Pmi06nite_22960 [Planotetraspora mira]